MSGALPDFLIAGAQKSGTTALWINLSRHPQVYMARYEDRGGKREIHFFDEEANWARGVKWYRSLFPESGRIQGEKTPEYMLDPDARERMYQVVPHVKLVILLRNPVTRAYSHWNHFRDANGSEGTFEQAIEWARKEGSGPFRTMLTRGNYIDQIQSLLRFFPREKLYVGISERFRADPVSEYNKLLRFIGCDQAATDYQDSHLRSYPGAMEEPVRAMLTDYYRGSVEQLRDLLDDDIVEWKQRGVSR